MTHDYAEIYTPSCERNPWVPAQDGSTSSGSVSELSTPKPPTPPLHRFPSWESRIYQVNTRMSFRPRDHHSSSRPLTRVHAPARFQVAAEGLQVNTSCSHPNSTDSTNNNGKLPSGYCDISVPVYATVKGVSLSPCQR